MRLWGAFSIFALTAGALAASPIAKAQNGKVLEQLRDDFKGGLQDRDRDHDDGGRLKDYKHIVVIYQENHSFDNLYGLWGRVGEDGVRGLPDADPAHCAGSCR